MDAPASGRTDSQVRITKEETDARPPESLQAPGEYPHSGPAVGIISSRHLVALSIILALLALHLQLNRNWPGYYRRNSYAWGDDDGDEPDPWRCTENITWTTFPDPSKRPPPPYLARTTFNIPVSATSISFMALDRTGSYGSFRVSQSSEPGSEALVEIETRCETPEMIANVGVCRLHRCGCDMNGADPWRFGITSGKETGEKVEINIHLRLPTPIESDSPLMIRDLWTSLPLYSHHFEGLSQSVRFSRLRVISTEGDIIMAPICFLTILMCHTSLARRHSYTRHCLLLQAVLGDDISVHSTVGSIRRIFNVSDSLHVFTAGGATELRANLLDGRASDKLFLPFHDVEPSVHTSPTRLVMFTDTGPIDAQVALYDSTFRNDSASQPEHTIARFEVRATAADAPINITFVDAPSKSEYALSVDAEAHVVPEGLPWWWRSSLDSSAPITVKLHEAYEGSFKLETTKRVRPSVEWDTNEDGTPNGADPSGQGRERHIEVQSGRGMAEGDIWWGTKQDASEWSRLREKSRVVLKAATSAIRLAL